MNKNWAVIFDMDGVMVDSNPFHRIALEVFCRKHGFNLTEEELRTKVFGRTNKDWLQNIFNGKLTLEELKKYADEKEAHFREIYAPHIKPVRGLIKFLEILKENQIPRAIATSAPFDNVQFVLEKTGTASFFDIILDDSHISRSKPDPEIYLRTAEKLKMPPSACVVIEDSLSGVKSAKTADCKVIGITTTHSREELQETDKIIDHFEELHLQDLEILF